MMRRFARIGIEPGKPFDHSTMSGPEKRALIDGMAAGQAELKMLARSGVGKSVAFRETGEDTEKIILTGLICPQEILSAVHQGKS